MYKNQEYETGYKIGYNKGEKDISQLLPPSPTTDGTDIYKDGYANGYLTRYTQVLSDKIKQNKNTKNNKLNVLLKSHLYEARDCILKQNNKQK